MKKSKFWINCIIILLAFIVGGSILVTIANYMPINESIKEISLSQLASEGEFPAIPSMQAGYGEFHSSEPTTLELATDALMLKMALYQGEGEGIEQAFYCYSTQYEAEYSRYWHGYVVILRVLLLLFDYYEIRILNGICQMAVLALAAFGVWKMKGTKYALALVTSYVLLMPQALAQCLQYTWVFYVAFGALLVYLAKKQFWEEGNRYLYLFLAVGALTIYVDLLTYPLFTWGLLAVWFILLQEKEDTPFGYMKKVVFSAFAWIAGYGGMWIGKWLVGSMVLRQNLFAKAFSEALLWTVNEGEAAITFSDRLEGIYQNWITYDYKIYLIILLSWLAYWLIDTLVFGYKKNGKATALLLVSCSSLVWCFLMAGHVIMHHLFTHRMFGVSIAAFLGVILLSTQKQSEETNGEKTMLKLLGILVLAGAASVLFMFQIKDSYYEDNGHLPFTQIEWREPVSMSFTPQYDNAFSLTGKPNVTTLYLGFSVVDATTGYCRMTLLAEGIVEDCRELPISECLGKNFQQVDADWELKAGKEYTIVLEPMEVDGTLLLWVSCDGETSLAEYGEVFCGENGLGGQLLGGIIYWCTPPAGASRLLLAMTYLGIILMVLYSLSSFQKGVTKVV